MNKKNTLKYNFLEFFKYLTQKVGKKEVKSKVAPLNSGRQTFPEGVVSGMGSIYGGNIIKPPFQREFLGLLKHLAIHNKDISMGVDNYVRLGGTGYSIKFEDKVNERVKREMMEVIRDREKKLYSAGGIGSLVNDLLTQLAISGVISCEMVVDRNLEGLEKVVLVSPESIVFQWSKENGHEPYQININTGLNITTEGIKKLDTRTYLYIPYSLMGENPYGIPPMIPAIQGVELQEHMTDNMRHIIKKIGGYGFLQILCNLPEKDTSVGTDGKGAETEEEYQQRLTAFLERQGEEAEKSFATGLIVGGKDSHEFKMGGELPNSGVAKELQEIIQKMVIVGLKQDPNMLGQNFTQTETMGRVILTKLSSQISNMQKIVAGALESILLLELQLKGYPINRVFVEFEKPLIGDELKSQNARAKKFEVLQAMYKQGILSQEEIAIRMGYEKAYLPKPLEDSNVKGKEGKGEDKGEDNKKTDPDNTEPPKEKKGENENSTGIHSCMQKIEVKGYNFKYNDAIQNTMYSKYVGETTENYKKGVDRAVEEVIVFLSSLGAGFVDERTITELSKFHFYKNWDSNFSSHQKKVVKKWIEEAYKEFRWDTSIFRNGDAPSGKGIFSVTDRRTMEYFKDSDDLYLGKFIQDEDTRRRMTKFIKDEFLEGNLAQGRNKKTLEVFRKSFTKLLEGEEYKIQRVIATTISKLKNYASVSYMTQAEVQAFSIWGIPDTRQCEYCKAMQGRVFSVPVWSEKVANRVEVEPSSASIISPFLVNTFKGDTGISKLKTLSSNSLQSLGFGLPPYHPYCRDTIVAM